MSKNSPMNPDNKPRSCRGPSRGELLKFGGLSLFGLGLPQLLAGRSAPAAAVNANRRFTGWQVEALHRPVHARWSAAARNWDPKPERRSKCRGDIGSIATSVPGIRVGEFMPLTARQMDKICILRAMSTGRQRPFHQRLCDEHRRAAHSAGRGVCPARSAEQLSFDRRDREARLRPAPGPRGALPAAITLTEVLANDGNKTWPGQDGGFLGRGADPWVLPGDPAAPNYQVQDLAPAVGVAEERMHERLSLWRSSTGG